MFFLIFNITVNMFNKNPDRKNRTTMWQLGAITKLVITTFELLGQLQRLPEK